MRRVPRTSDRALRYGVYLATYGQGVSDHGIDLTPCCLASPSRELVQYVVVWNEAVSATFLRIPQNTDHRS
jgi:hypothetical protein